MESRAYELEGHTYKLADIYEILTNLRELFAFKNPGWGTDLIKILLVC